MEVWGTVSVRSTWVMAPVGSERNAVFVRFGLVGFGSYAVVG
jgi:hypothetical protein